MWLKQCHKPSMTGNGNYTTVPPIKMVKWGMVNMALFYQHIINQHQSAMYPSWKIPMEIQAGHPNPLCTQTQALLVTLIEFLCRRPWQKREKVISYGSYGIWWLKSAWREYWLSNVLNHTKMYSLPMYPNNSWDFTNKHGKKMWRIFKWKKHLWTWGCWSMLIHIWGGWQFGQLAGPPGKSRKNDDHTLFETKNILKPRSKGGCDEYMMIMMKYIMK